MDLLKSAEVKDLFQKEAILLGTMDGVPVDRAAKLFGEEAACFAARYEHGGNGFGIGDYTLSYLTFRGFQMAATFHNVSALKKAATA